MVQLACRLDTAVATVRSRLSAITFAGEEYRVPVITRRRIGRPVPIVARPRTSSRCVSRQPFLGRLIAGSISAVLAVTLAVAIAVPAGAVPPPPENPSDQQIQDSQQQAAAAAAEVGRLAGLVSKTEGDIERLKDDMELKAEQANKAAVDLQVAQSDAAAALSASHQAQADAGAASQAIVDAKTKAASFAAASFRQGFMRVQPFNLHHPSASPT